MAGGDNAWASLAARSRRGVVGTLGAQIPSMAGRGVIGGLPEVDEDGADGLAQQGVMPMAPSTGQEVATTSLATKSQGDALEGLEPVGTPAVAGEVHLGVHEDDADGSDMIPEAFRPNPMAALARRKDMEPVRRVYEKQAQSPYAALAGESRPVTAIRDVQAVKIVNHLVCGITLSPGSSAPKNVKSQVLRDQILQIHGAAQDVVEAMGVNPERQEWLVAQCAETLSAAVAQHQLARPGATGEQVSAFVDEAQALIVSALSRSNDDLSEVVGRFVHSRYRAVSPDDPAAADDRLRVSLAGAAGDMLDKVLSPCLSLGGQHFSYGMEPARVVEILCAELLQIATKASIDVSSTDLQISHLQGSLRRVAALIGHEYVHTTLGILQWIQPGPEAPVDASRLASAQGWLTGAGVGEIVAKAKAGFLMVERIAPTLLEQAKADGALPPSARAVERGG